MDKDQRKAERLRQEAAWSLKVRAIADDGTKLDFECIAPPPAAIVWRLDQSTFLRFDDERTAKAFLLQFGNDAYRLATNIQARD